MKYLLWLSCILFFVSCMKKETREPATYSIAQFMDNEVVSSGGFSPDKSKLLVTSNRSGIHNMYTMSTSGGDMEPLTQSDTSSVYAISYFPDDERILFTMDGNGDEIYKLFVKDGEQINLITPPENVRAVFYTWARDGNSFYYGSNERDIRYMDVYRMDCETFTPAMIFRNEAAYSFGSISNDGKFMAFTKALNTNDSDLFLYDVESQLFTKINAVQSSNAPQTFSIDNDELYYTTDVDNEFAYLMKYDIVGEKSERILERDWDIWGMALSHHGKYQRILTNVDGANVIEIIESDTDRTLELPKVDNAFITAVSISKDETMAVLSVGGSHTPTNLYVYDLENNTETKLTDVLNEAIDPDDLVTAEIIRYPSFDGLEIPAVYYKPHRASVDNKVPALVWVHGGPGGQSRQNFNAMFQYLVNHGYAVLAVNNRGSSGYGKTFFQMDDQNHGEKDLQDCIAGKNWLAQQPDIDAEKIGIIGGSFGGFMTMAALTFAPEEFEVGVNIYGVTNWLRTLRSIPPWWESVRDALFLEMGNPYTEDSIRLHKISPLFHTAHVTKPLMVLQGAQDPRVLQVESDEIVENVRKNGVPVEYILFEDEGHGFVKKENQIIAYEGILNFLDTYLKGETNE